MENMIYTSKRGKQIVFDDYEDNVEEFNIYWVYMCPHCHNKYRSILGSRVDNGCGSGICSVKGCEREASYYADFDASEVKFVLE